MYSPSSGGVDALGLLAATAPQMLARGAALPLLRLLPFLRSQHQPAAPPSRGEGEVFVHVLIARPYSGRASYLEENKL